jgi:trans-aconitate methyltransferase
MTNLVVNRSLDPRDHMFNTGPDWYWAVGESGLRAVRKALTLADEPPVRRVLDLPSGHGRVGRYLRAGFPDAEFFFCDLDADGAEFCARAFGGTSLPSQAELTAVDLPRDCDVIWVGSLFTHVDRDRTERWLRWLCGALSPTGVLVATFHGPWAIQVHRHSAMIDESSWAQIVDGYERSGFGYARYPYMSDADYGVSLSKPSVIVGMVERIPSVRLLAYTERAWADNHDVLVVSRVDRLAPWP